MPDPILVFAVASPYAWDVRESALRAGLDPLCVDNRDDADPALGAVRPDEVDPRLAMTLGLSSAAGRRAAAEAAHAAGFDAPVALVDPHAVVPSTARIDHGAYLNAGVVVGSNSRIGCHANVNRSASVGHDCRLGFAASLGPGAVLTGHVVVEAAAFVGAAAVVLPGVRIGTGATVGAGSVVTRDVAPGSVVVGNPAREIRATDGGEEPTCPHCATD